MKTENDKETQNFVEDDLSFLNSLPEVKKKPKPDLFAEHLSFLNSLPSIQTEKTTPHSVEEESVPMPPVFKEEKLVEVASLLVAEETSETNGTKEHQSFSTAKSRMKTEQTVAHANSRKEPVRSSVNKQPVLH